ncbi:MAG: AAA family ATPase [Candidatus Sericytochromatia bacterium]|nr:AAA family ATPase [Candidatus Sericytochromatia bacterium]
MPPGCGHPAAVSRPPERMPTELLDHRYQIVQRLGEGAMGAVYQVEERASGKTLAMKVISRKVEGGEKSYLQLKQEFRLMTQLRHPNCCAVYDYGLLNSGAPFFTMELVPGRGLDEMLPVPLADVRGILGQLLLALGYIHQLGYLHSDIKSANVRIRPDGTAKLMDYGLMELAGRSGGAIRGTVGYLAPEVVRRGRLDRRADLYALGVLAYEMITGQLPFQSDQLLDLLRMHLSQAPTPPSVLQPAVDPSLEHVVMRLLAKEPLDRYQSAYDVLDALGMEVPQGIGGSLLASPLVGRQETLTRLQTAVSVMETGPPGERIFIWGESGIGKSRLLEELRFAAQLADLHHIQATPRNTPAPYGPILDLLRRALPFARRLIPEVLARVAPVLVKLLPDLAEETAIEPAPDLDPPAREKARLQDCIATLLGELARQAPLVVALDDWHRADELSQELLEHLVRNVSDARLLLVVASRQLPETLPTWLAQAERLQIAPLPATAVDMMVSSMLGDSAVSERLTARALDFSKGNPLLIEQLLEHLVRERILTNQAGHWQTDIEIPDENLPSDGPALLLRQLEALSPDVRRLATHAAVVGENFTLEWLQAATEQEEEHLFDALQALEIAQIIVPEEGGGYRFAQPELQRVLLEEVPSSLRRPIHARILTVLEHEARGEGPERLPLELITALARHSLEAQASDQAIVYALEAGNRRSALYALQEAETFLDQGLALLREAPSDRWSPVLLRYLEQLGFIRRARAQAKEAKEVQAEAIDLAEHLGAQRELGRLLGSQAKACLVLQESAVALEYCSRAILVSEAAGDSVNQTRCLLVAARLHFYAGDLPTSLRMAEQAAAIAETSFDVTSQGSAYAFAGYVCVASSDPAQIPHGISQLQRSLTLLLSSGDKLGLVNSYNLLGNAQNALGEPREAWESFQAGRALAFESGSRSDEVVAVLNLAITALELGNLSEVRERAQEAEALSSRYGVKYTHGYAMSMRALGDVLAGAGQESLALMERALVFTRDLRNKYVEALVLMYQVELLLNLGQWKEALTASQALREVIDATGNPEPETRLNAMLAELHLHRDELPDAEWRVELAYQAAKVALSKGMQARALRIKAQVAVAREQWREAANWAQEALELAIRVGNALEQARVYAILGEIALAQGHSQARQHFLQMRQLAEEVGSPSLQAQAHFGLAAAAPYAPEAPHQVEQARRLLEGARDALPKPARGAFESVREHHRVLQEGHLAFSLARRPAERPPWLLQQLRERSI